MARILRCGPGMTAPRQVLEGKTYLVTRRCSERRFFLRPDELTNDLFVYLLGLSAEMHEVEVHAACVLSNHYHLVVTDPKARLPAFVQYLNALLARSLNAVYGHWEHFWGPSSYSAVTLEGPGAILDKIAYTLANPVAAGLVWNVKEWPGVRTLPEEIGTATSETPRPKGFLRADGPMPESSSLKLTVPPGFESVEEFRRQLDAALEAKLEVARRGKNKSKVLGREKILKQRRTDFPRSREKKRGVRPKVAAEDRWKRIEALQRLESFIEAYRAAWERLKQKVHDVVFPAGTYWLRVTQNVTCAPG